MAYSSYLIQIGSGNTAFTITGEKYIAYLHTKFLPAKDLQNRFFQIRRRNKDSSPSLKQDMNLQNTIPDIQDYEWLEQKLYVQNIRCGIHILKEQEPDSRTSHAHA